MKSLVLRFSENFAQENGTIAEHQKLIDKIGYVYYGKMGSSLSEKNINLILSQEVPKTLFYP